APPPLGEPPRLASPAPAASSPQGYAPMNYAGPGQGYPGADFSQPTKTSAAAVTSLVMGILSVCPAPGVLSIPAVLTGIIGVRRTGNPRVSGRGMAVAGISLGALGLLVLPLALAIFVPAFSRARDRANQVKCASNMSWIGQQLMMYAQVNGGHFPNRLDDLV